MNKRGMPHVVFLTIAILLLSVCSNWLCAQTLQPNANASTFNWKTGEDATTILLSQVDVLHQQLPGLTEGTSLYDNTLRRIAYFKAIAVEISKGASVVESLDLAVPAAATLGFSKEASYTPKITLRALQTETRILLTN
jgi:hypothetical protein